MAKKYVSASKLSLFLEKLKGIFASKSDIDELSEDVAYINVSDNGMAEVGEENVSAIVTAVDSELSVNSMNPIQNRAVAEKFASIEEVGVRAAQADWDENDETSPSYVKNRVCRIEKLENMCSPEPVDLLQHSTGDIVNLGVTASYAYISNAIYHLGSSSSGIRSGLREVTYNTDFKRVQSYVWQTDEYTTYEILSFDKYGIKQNAVCNIIRTGTILLYQLYFITDPDNLPDEYKDLFPEVGVYLKYVAKPSYASQYLNVSLESYNYSAISKFLLPITAQKTENLTTSISSDSDDSHYPSAKAVYNAVSNTIASPQTAEVGDMLTVEETDDDGKPVKWKATPVAEQVQADWNESDSTANGYIKNRPFYDRSNYLSEEGADITTPELNTFIKVPCSENTDWIQIVNLGAMSNKHTSLKFPIVAAMNIMLYIDVAWTNASNGKISHSTLYIDAPSKTKVISEGNYIYTADISTWAAGSLFLYVISNYDTLPDAYKTDITETGVYAKFTKDVSSKFSNITIFLGIEFVQSFPTKYIDSDIERTYARINDIEEYSDRDDLYPSVKAVSAYVEGAIAEYFESDITGEVVKDELIKATTNGTFISGASHNRTGYIKVSSDDMIFYTGRINNYAGVAGYDEDKKYVCCILANEGEAKTYTDQLLTIPEGVVYIAACSLGANTNPVKITRRRNLKKNLGEVENLADECVVMDNISSDSGILPDFESFGAFANFTVIGDSLASGLYPIESDENGSVTKWSSVNSKDYSWGSYLGKMTGADVINYAISGSTAKSWCENENGLTAMLSGGKTQAYIIGLGVNDLAKIEEGAFEGGVGTLSDINVEGCEQNADSFIGWYAKIVQKIMEFAPDAKIFCLGNPKLATRGDAPFELIEAMCEMDYFSGSAYFVNMRKWKRFYEAAPIANYRRGIHYSAPAYRQMARIMLAAISERMDEDARDFETIPLIEYDDIDGAYSTRLSAMEAALGEYIDDVDGFIGGDDDNG